MKKVTAVLRKSNYSGKMEKMLKDGHLCVLNHRGTEHALIVASAACTQYDYYLAQVVRDGGCLGVRAQVTHTRGSSSVPATTNSSISADTIKMSQ